MADRAGGSVRPVRLAFVLVALATPATAQDLTPVGAERAGNADGTIPEWTGGIARADWPPAFKRGGRYLDPFGADAPSFVITAENHARHAQHLSRGQLALFQRYKTYRMPVYPTRRSVGFPEAIYEATRANAGRARLVGVDQLEGARLGFPFAEPRSGAEVLWNHKLRYRGDDAHWTTLQAVVTPGGLQRRITMENWTLHRYANLLRPGDSARDNVLYHIAQSADPIMGCGQHVHAWREPLNPVRAPRQLWCGCASRKVWRAPSGRGHDDFSLGSEMIRYFDMLDMFTGELDRYTFKLLGKREVYIPYNSYRLSDGRSTYDGLLTPLHFNQDSTRYELHRVWVVDALRRSGVDHRIRRRVFYVDEDSWTIALVDIYEAKGAVSRHQEGHILPLYDVQAVEPAPQLVYQVESQRYFASHLFAEHRPPEFNTGKLTEADFTQAGIKRRHLR
jgi:hypothetical protein